MREEIERLAAEPEPPREEARDQVAELLDALERGEVRAARPTPAGWEVCEWVKRGILLGFRVGVDRAFAPELPFGFRDRDLFPPRADAGTGVRVVPGGSAIRRGAYLAPGVVVMPPAYVNVGAWVDRGSMIDSHVLVGSCAQIGSGVHLSAGAQIGGVLEPVGAAPVIVESSAFVGGGCGIFEGARIGEGAVLAPGVVVSRAVPLYDLVHEREHRADADGVLTVPAGAVVVPGARAVAGEFARTRGLSLSAPCIVKYRDPGTDAAVALEGALR